MKCRIDIEGRKIWVDGGNAYGTRPPSVDITLLRDGNVAKTITLNSASDGHYRFPCLVVAKDSSINYVYKVDEATVPAGYSKKIQGYNIVNTLNEFTLNGTKIWDDNYNADNTRPATVTVRLFRNGVEIDDVTVAKPLDTEDRTGFTFDQVPFADLLGVPYVYTVDEDTVANYTKTIDGFNIINTIKTTTP